MKKVSRPSIIATITGMVYIFFAVLLPSGYVAAQAMGDPQAEDYLGEEQEKIYESGQKYFDFKEFDQCGADSGASFSGGEVDPSFSLGSGERERRVNLAKALMNDYGLTAAQAAGIVGNFMQESGGPHLPPNVNQGGRAGPPVFVGGGYGWAQWTGGNITMHDDGTATGYGGRQGTFIAFAINKHFMSGPNVSATDAANYAYLKHELDTGYKNTITQLKKQKTPELAAWSFHATFEKSSDSPSEIGERGTDAKQVYDEILGINSPTQGGNVEPTSPDGPCPGGVSTGATIDGFTYPLATKKSNIGPPGIHSNGTTSRGGHPYIAFDILTPPGVPIVASLPGVVSHIGTDRCPGALVSVYTKEKNMVISYLHMSFDLDVREGQQVIGGQQLGVVGAAQNGCGTPHLHIDAARGTYRPGCSRLNCPTANASRFIDIGPALFDSFQLLPP